MTKATRDKQCGDLQVSLMLKYIGSIVIYGTGVHEFMALTLCIFVFMAGTFDVLKETMIILLPTAYSDKLAQCAIATIVVLLHLLIYEVSFTYIDLISIES